MFVLAWIKVVRDLCSSCKDFIMEARQRLGNPKNNIICEIKSLKGRRHISPHIIHNIILGEKPESVFVDQ